MANIDIIGTYFPALADIPPEDVRAARLRLTNYLVRGNPALDMRPNTPFGDLWVTPAAEHQAALEVAVTRMFSDLDLEHVAGGTIWNCEFVERYLKNFAAVPLDSIPATGIVRLIFNKDQEYELNKGLQMSFIEDDVAVFTFRLAHDGPLHLRPVKAPTDTRENQYRLVQLAPDQYAADVPVTGFMLSPVTAGATGRTSEEVECLLSVIALIDFDDGVPEDSLSKIAERSRSAFHAMTLASRNGAISFILRQFPEVRAVSPVLSGDDEMVRDSFNALGISTGGMDVHVRSTHALQEITQQVQINFYTEQESESQDVFVGEVKFLHPPHLIKSITHADNATLDLGARDEDVVVFSTSADPAIAPGLLCAFSPLETLYVTIKMPRTVGGAPLIDLLFDAANQAYAWFDITYLTDPLLETIYDHVTAEDNRPVGSRVHVRGFNLVHFDSLTIDYRRRPGTTINLTKAQAEIFDYMNTRGGPEFPYSDGPVVDAAFYAGVQQVMAIKSSAQVLWTPADRFLLPTATLPTANYNDALVEATIPNKIYIHDSGSFQPSWQDPLLGQAGSLYAAIGERNTAYLVEQDNIKFNQV